MVAIAWAVTEHLHDRTGAKTIFATHYHELTDLADEVIKTRIEAVSGVGEELEDLGARQRQADALRGGKDPKLTAATPLIKEMVMAGHRPIVFCRFIDTAHYVAQHLTTALGTAKTPVHVAAVTGHPAGRVTPGTAWADLGLDSLMAIQVRNKVEAGLGVSLSLVDFLKGLRALDDDQVYQNVEELQRLHHEPVGVPVDNQRR